jgi:hypothetical protein
MADIADVENSLVSLASAALYPNGTAASSVPGADCRIYRGWPNSAALDADLSKGTINVTVFPGGGVERTTTRYSEQWVGNQPSPSLTTEVADDSVTFVGTPAAGQVAGILVGRQAYAYRVQNGDTPGLVAANLAALISSNSIVNLSGNTVTVAGACDLMARVVSNGVAQREVRRQEQSFRISCWCPTPTTRDATAAAIDQSLSTMFFIPLADGTSGRLTYIGTNEFDQSQNAKLFRRDLTYLVEYPTILSATEPAMLFGQLVINTATFTV